MSESYIDVKRRWARQQLTYDGCMIVLATPDDTIVHTKDRSFCDDMDCPCHEDSENVNALNEQIEQGFLTEAEAKLILMGKVA